MQPVLVNPNSRFLVATYWWGRGKLNRNTARDCDPAANAPSHTYDQLAERWQTACAKARCNHMAVERPDFARKGFYQQAINHKPEFILAALDVAERHGLGGVLYVDSDMVVNRYPHVFDTPGLDFASVNDAFETRIMSLANGEGELKPCFYPWKNKISGGTLYFSTSAPARDLLASWASLNRRSPKRADDRLLSILTTERRSTLRLRYMPLPVEFIWLRILDEQPDLKKAFEKHRKHRQISHPFCDTAEDDAAAMDAAAQREPPRFNAVVNQSAFCYSTRPTSVFYAHVFCNNRATQGVYRGWAENAQDMGYVRYVPPEDRYGVHNDVARDNEARARTLAAALSPTGPDCTVGVIDMSKKRGGGGGGVDYKDLVPLVLCYLRRGLHVVVHDGAHHASVRSVMDRGLRGEYDLVCMNLAASASDRARFRLRLAPGYPVFFGAWKEAEVLRHALVMCARLSSLADIMNSSYFFQSRTRALYLYPTPKPKPPPASGK